MVNFAKARGFEDAQNAEVAMLDANVEERRQAWGTKTSNRWPRQSREALGGASRRDR